MACAISLFSFLVPFNFISGLKMAQTPINTVLFDLDGTLIDVDMHQFIPAYLTNLAKSIDRNLDREQFVQTMISRTMELLASDDGSQTNEEFYRNAVFNDLGVTSEQFSAGLQRFYRDHLDQLAPLVSSTPLARKLIERCQDLGFDVVIATNPVFPRPVVDARLQWAGVGDFNYRLVTSFENSRYCKPNPRYFSAIFAELNCDPQSVLMVGNDTEHDLSASQLGVKTFLVDTWMIDRDSPFIADHRGSHLDLYHFLGQLPALT